jgi:hypothetical protein
MPILNEKESETLKNWFDAHKGATLRVTRRIATYPATGHEFEYDPISLQFVTDWKNGEHTEGDLYAKPVFERKGQSNDDLLALFKQAAQDVKDHATTLNAKRTNHAAGGCSGIETVVAWATYKHKVFVLFHVPLYDPEDILELDGTVHEVYRSIDPAWYIN